MIRPNELLPDKTTALKLTPVSRETEKRLDAYVALLLIWQEMLYQAMFLDMESIFWFHNHVLVSIYVQ